MDNNKEVFNIIISGVGGQGVFSLTKVLWKLCENAGIKCQGSVFKGGAQRMGTIHSTIRLFYNNSEKYANYSVQILKGELDLIIGMEPWETLRYHKYFNKDTKIIMNKSIYPLFIDRYKDFSIKDPIEAIRNMGLYTISKDYSQEAIEKYGTKKMTNFLLGIELVKLGMFKFSNQDFLNTFSEIVDLPEDLTI